MAIFKISGTLVVFMALQIDCFNLPINNVFCSINSESFKSRVHRFGRGLSKLRSASYIGNEMSFDAGINPLEQENLDGFMFWAKKVGITCNKIALNQLDSGERGCFATQDIHAGEIFLRVNHTSLFTRQFFLVVISGVISMSGT